MIESILIKEHVSISVISLFKMDAIKIIIKLEIAACFGIV